MNVQINTAPMYYKDPQTGQYVPVVGIQGPQGDTGPQGSKGDKGDKGDPGDDYVITQENIEEIGGMVADSEAVTDVVDEMYKVTYGTDREGTPVPSTDEHYENNANYLLGLTRQVKDEAETLVGDLAKEATLREVESEAQQSVELLEQILAEGHSSGDLNGYSLAPGAGNEVILTYTDPETEEASSVIMITNTTGQAIADALEEEMLMWKELVENAS